MSYLDRLMAHTGIEIALFPPAPLQQISSVVEVDAVDVAATAPTLTAPSEPVPPRQSGERADLSEVSPPPFAATRPMPDTPARVETVEAAQRLEPQVARSSPQHPEIVIEERIVEKIVPREQQVESSSPNSAPLVATKVERPEPPRRDVPGEHDETRRPSNSRTQAVRMPTLIEVRNWVAATPEPSERAEARARPPHTAVESAPLMIDVPSRDAHVPVAAITPAAPSVQHVDLSIGSIQVTVEMPPQAPPAPPVAVTAPRAADTAPAWSRLSRRYVRV